MKSKWIVLAFAAVVSGQVCAQLTSRAGQRSEDTVNADIKTLIRAHSPTFTYFCNKNMTVDRDIRVKCRERIDELKTNFDLLYAEHLATRSPS
jgi:hypothetical protein